MASQCSPHKSPSKSAKHTATWLHLATVPALHRLLGITSRLCHLRSFFFPFSLLFERSPSFAKPSLTNPSLCFFHVCLSSWLYSFFYNISPKTECPPRTGCLFNSVIHKVWTRYPGVWGDGPQGQNSFHSNTEMSSAFSLSSCTSAERGFPKAAWWSQLQECVPVWRFKILF